MTNKFQNNAVVSIIDDDPAVIADHSRNTKSSFQPPRIVDVNGYINNGYTISDGYAINNNSYINIDASGLADAINSGLLEFKDSGLSIRMDTEALLESISYHENTIEGVISSGLGDKMHIAEANLFAIEFGQLINSSAYKNGKTVEERAVNRETGVMLTENFAHAYFDDPDEKRAFIQNVIEYAMRDEMLDKGYYFWHGKAYESYKPIPASVAGKKGDAHWNRKTVEEFEAKEKEATDTIKKARATVNDDVAAKKLEQILERFNMIWNTLKEDEILGETQWAFRYSK